MQKYTDAVQNRLGLAVEGAKVRVTDINGSVATIFSNNGTTQQPNPMTTDANGRFAFYAADGRYNLTVTINNVQQGEQLDILLNDPADHSAEKIDGGVITNSQVNSSEVNNCIITGGTAQQVTITGSTISQSALEDVTIEGLPPMTVGGQKYQELIEKDQLLTSQSREALRRSYADAGYNLVDGSFEEGGALTSTDDVMITASCAGYSWPGPEFPHNVAKGTDPTLPGSGYVPRTDVVLRGQLAATGGAGNIGIDMLAAYKLGTIGAQMVPLPAVDNTGVTDSTAIFNAKLLSMANAGGGVLKPIPGTYKINGTILLPSYIVLDLTGVTLTGAGSNNLIENAAVIGGVLTSIISEHGDGYDGNGTHATYGSVILNGTLANAAIGIRGHRMNFGCRIDGTFFASSLGVSWEICHSWGMKITSCTVYAPAKNHSFVDWSEISGNSFEGITADDANSYALEISNGSYSLEIHSNGFHHFNNALRLNGELTNTIITSNHFEDCHYFIVGDSQTKTGLQIHSNWMKANLKTPSSHVIAIVLNSSRHGKMGPNFYSTDGVSDFDAHVVCSTSNCIGNEIVVPHTVGNQVDLTKYQISATNKIVATGGSNDDSLSQPWVETWAGTAGYTIEKYRSRYHAVPNAIPLCTVNYSGTTITIDTFVPTDAHGGTQLVAYNFKVTGSVTSILAGHICHSVVKEVVNADYYSGGSPLVMTITNNAGFMRITITGAASGGYITGWVKEI